MVDQEQTTTNETETTEAASTTDTESDTSTTQAQETVDLSKSGETETTTEKTEEVEETEEQKAAREEHETLFGAPAEGEDYKIEGLPEGMEIDKDALEAVVPVARELGLSSKGLSKIAQVYAEKVLPGVAQKVTNDISANITAKHSEWEGQARDAIAGKGEPLVNKSGEPLTFNGESLESVMATSAKALDKIAPAGFREFLDESGLAKNPYMIAFAYHAGKLIAEDRDIEATETTKDRPTSAAEKRKAGGMDTQKFFKR